MRHAILLIFYPHYEGACAAAGNKRPEWGQILNSGSPIGATATLVGQFALHALQPSQTKDWDEAISCRRLPILIIKDQGEAIWWLAYDLRSSLEQLGLSRWLCRSLRFAYLFDMGFCDDCNRRAHVDPKFACRYTHLPHAKSPRFLVRCLQTIIQQMVYLR